VGWLQDQPGGEGPDDGRQAGLDGRERKQETKRQRGRDHQTGPAQANRSLEKV
jgi:hypothetical protein